VSHVLILLFYIVLSTLLLVGLLPHGLRNICTKVVGSMFSWVLHRRSMVCIDCGVINVLLSAWRYVILLGTC
jgi:hypothetical protein